MDNNKSSPVQEVQSQIPVANNSSSRSKIIPIGLGVFFVSVAVIFYMLGTRQNQTVVSNQQNTTVPTVITTPLPNPTANWKTYKNEEFGFELKYPSEEWEIVEEKAIEDYSNIVRLSPKVNGGRSDAPEIGIAIAHRSLDQEKEKREKNGIKYNYTKITIAGRDGYSSGLLQGYEGVGKEVLISANNIQTFIVSTQNAINIFDQILSTFQFTQ